MPGFRLLLASTSLIGSIASASPGWDPWTPAPSPADLAPTDTERITAPASLFGLAAIRMYQALLSPALGGRCQFDPSCSRYAFSCIASHGLIAGTWRGADRISRCHGFAELGDYPVAVHGHLIDSRRVSDMTIRVAILFLTIATNVRAEDTAAIRRFADERFAASDWFRAATEYLRAASYDPASPDRDELLFSAARSAYRAERYAESRRDLIALAGTTSSTDLSDRCRFVAAAASFRLKEYDAARGLAADTRANSPNSPLRDRLAYLEGWSALHAGKWNATESAFSSVADPSPLARSALDLHALAQRGSKRTPRCPWVTGILSALIPGLGQAVSGYPWDGLSAMLLVGSGAALIASGLDRDRDAYVTSGIIIISAFYPANIWGGANAATRADHRDRTRLLADADRLSTLSLE